MTTGYTTLDVIHAHGAITHHAGGTAANIAADLAWLGLPVHLLARIGEDGPGRVIQAELSAEGVAGALLVRDPEVQTPLVLHEVRRNGTHRFLFNCPVCQRPFPRYRPVSIEQAEAAIDLNPEIVLIDRASRAALILAEAVRDNGGLVIFEPNTRGRPALTQQAVQVAHVVKTTRQRAAELGSLLRTTTARQVQIRSAGAGGVHWRVGTNYWRHEPAFNFEGPTVDAGGAGDWLTAGLIASLPTTGWRTTDVLTDAIRFGQALAALACQHVGARGLNQARSRRDVLQQISHALMWRTSRPTNDARRRLRRAANSCRGCLRHDAA